MSCSTRLLCALAVSLPLAATAARADVLYSVNAATDELVTVDTQTGTVTVVGAIGRNVMDPDLAFGAGRIYMADRDNGAGTCDLVELDLNTGAQISRTAIQLAGQDVTAEGLTYSDGLFYIGFSPTGSAASDRLGTVSTSTGSISNVVDFSSVGADFDGLGTYDQSCLINVDSTGISSQLYQAEKTSATYTALGPLHANINLQDIATSPGGLFAIDNLNNQIHELDPATGALLASVSLSPSVSLGGLTPRCFTPYTYCTGKTTSQGCVPYIVHVGMPSVSSTEPFTIRGEDHVPVSPGLLLYGFKKANLNFHGGKLCVKAPISRSAGKTAKSKASTTCAGGASTTGRLSINFNNVIQSGANPLLTVGVEIRAQWAQRDSAQTIGGFADNLSNGIHFVICP